jgi:hypothetical protein
MVAWLLPFAAAGAGGDHPALTPEEVVATVAVDGYFELEKTVHTPEIPPMLDFFLVVDLSGSYGDDLPNIKGASLALCNTIQSQVPDSQFGLATFIDYPYRPWGNADVGDYAYRLDQDLTGDCNVWDGAVQAMVTQDGGDGPESQYEALFQLATGTGRDVGAAGPSLGDIPAGLGGSFRAGSSRAAAITTDASFHTTGDSNCFAHPDCPFPYPGPDEATTVAALNASGSGIKVVAIKAPDSGSEMDDLATLTGGSVVTTSSTSEEIADAILEGLGNLPVDVSMDTDCAGPIFATFDPAVQTVISGDDAFFTETIWVAPDAAPGDYHCDDWALIDGEPMTDPATGDIIVEHKDITVAAAFCEEGVNPAGKTPKAPGTGQNEDGFYLIGAYPMDAMLHVEVIDSGSGTVFGPFPTPTNIKYTENDDDISIRPGPGAVDYKIKGLGDAWVSFTDLFGNVSYAACLVPPPPK